MAAADRAVFVVDDDEAALALLVMMLRANGLPVRGYASAQALLDDLEPGARGCVVTDLEMPDMDGVELLGEIRRAGHVLSVIVLTGHADVVRAVAAMKAGASDFIQKPYDNDTILRTVQSCLAENDVAAVINDARNSAVRRLESLTARERQVLDLIVEGASNKVIAGRLTISPRTVEIYRANVMSKMRAESLSELIRITLSTRAA